MSPSTRRAWGWHRLTDRWAQKIVADAGVQPNDLVLDIGAGTGALTGQLLAAGAEVLAVELHPERVAKLRSRFGKHRLTVLPVDAAHLRLPNRPFRIVANPPFALTGQLLHQILAPGVPLLTAHLVLQRGNAKRWASGVIRGSRKWSCLYDLQVKSLLPRSAFIPRPTVDTAVLMISPRSRAR
ncbi:MAG: rRNA adenine N-6-methyltransferase family protein [Candidatus Dormibacteraceae bacterium]